MEIVSGGPSQLVAAVGAARADDEAGLAQVDDELLEVGPGQVLLGGDAGQAGRSGAVVAGELDHEPDAVLALRGERDGARAVVARPGLGVVVGSEAVRVVDLDIRVISSGLYGGAGMGVNDRRGGLR